MPSVAVPISVSDVEKFDLESWRLWLERGVDTWERPTRRSERASAFAPFVLTSSVEGPRRLARELRNMPGSVRARVRSALSACVETLWLPDGINRALFILELGAAVGLERPHHAIDQALSRLVPADEKATRELCAALVALTIRRCTTIETRDLASKLADRRFLNANTAALVFAKLARESLDTFDEDVRRIFPSFSMLPPSNSSVQFFLDRLIVYKSDAERVLPAVLGKSSPGLDLIYASLRHRRFKFPTAREIGEAGHVDVEDLITHQKLVVHLSGEELEKAKRPASELLLRHRFGQKALNI